MLIYYFEAFPDGKFLEGLFRKSVSVDEENETIEKIMEKNYDYLLEVKNPHVIASKTSLKLRFDQEIFRHSENSNYSLLVVLNADG